MTTATNSFATWQTGVAAVLADALGIDEVAVAWLGQPRAEVHGPRAQIEPLAIQHHGVDDRRVREADGVEESLGARTLVLQVRVWTPTQTLDASPRAYLERLRTRLRWTRVLAALQALGLAFERCGQPVHRPTTRDSRVIDEALIDVFLGFTWVEADESSPIGFIERVLVDAEYWRDVNDAPIDAGLQTSLDVEAPAP